MTGLYLGASYLIGSFPSSYLTVRLLRGVDVRETGSGNAGATNVARAAGTGAGLLVLALDMGKGVLPVVIGRHLGVGAGVLAAGAVAVVLGHVFPVFLGFRGGKGVATGAGVFGALAPSAAAAALAIFLITVVMTRYVSLGSILGVGSFPLWLWWLRGGAEPGEWLPLLAGALLAAGLIIAKHASNIRRLRAGSERRWGKTS